MIPLRARCARETGTAVCERVRPCDSECPRHVIDRVSFVVVETQTRVSEGDRRGASVVDPRCVFQFCFREHKANRRRTKRVVETRAERTLLPGAKRRVAAGHLAGGIDDAVCRAGRTGVTTAVRYLRLTP